MKQQFFQINLQKSEQQPSCISLENLVDQLQNPEFIKSLSECTDEEEMIKLFPIVGFGLQIQCNFKKEFKIKVRSISQIEKIIDSSGLQIITRDRPNCILPLLKKKEGNHQLLQCDLFKKKVSYLITKQKDEYENSYIFLIQSTLKYLIKIFNNLKWQQDMMNDIYETCEQVFMGTNLYVDQIESDTFRTSQFQLLIIFCKYVKGEIDTETIYCQYIQKIIQKKLKFELDEYELRKVFDSLNLNGQHIKNFENIQDCIMKLLDQNNYFYFKIFYGEFSAKLMQFFISKQQREEKLKKFLFQEIFMQSQDNQELNQKTVVLNQEQQKIQEQKSLILNFTKSEIYLNLLNLMIQEEFNLQNKINFSKSLIKEINKDNYYQFLQNHKKYDELALYYILNIKLAEKNSYEEGLFSFSQYMIIKLMKQISIRSLLQDEFLDQEAIKQSDVIKEKRCQIQLFSRIFEINGEQKEQVEQEIINTVTDICWINYQSLKVNRQNDADILKFLRNFANCLENQKQHMNLYQRYLNELAQFCLKIKLSTSSFKYFSNFEKNQLINLLPIDPFQANILRNIFEISKKIYNTDQTR